MKFSIHKTSGMARTGEISFRRGVVRTPAFMPVGTYGSVKSVTPEEVRERFGQVKARTEAALDTIGGRSPDDVTFENTVQALGHA